MSRNCLIKHVNIEQQVSSKNTHTTAIDDQAESHTVEQQCALVLVTHTDIGGALLNQAQRIFVAGTEQQLHGQLTDLYLLEINDDLPTEKLDEQFQRCITSLAGHNKVLLLTDLEGATPASLAIRQAQQRGWSVVTGLSLPMLLKAITHRNNSLPKLIDIIVQGAQDAVRVVQASTSGSGTSIPKAAGQSPQ